MGFSAQVGSSNPVWHPKLPGRNPLKPDVSQRSRGIGGDGHVVFHIAGKVPQSRSAVQTVAWGRERVLVAVYPEGGLPRCHSTTRSLHLLCGGLARGRTKVMVSTAGHYSASPNRSALGWLPSLGTDCNTSQIDTRARVSLEVREESSRVGIDTVGRSRGLTPMVFLHMSMRQG